MALGFLGSLASSAGRQGRSFLSEREERQRYEEEKRRREELDALQKMVTEQGLISGEAAQARGGVRDRIPFEPMPEQSVFDGVDVIGGKINNRPNLGGAPRDGTLLPSGKFYSRSLDETIDKDPRPGTTEWAALQRLIAGMNTEATVNQERALKAAGAGRYDNTPTAADRRLDRSMDIQDRQMELQQARGRANAIVESGRFAPYRSPVEAVRATLRREFPKMTPGDIDNIAVSAAREGMRTGLQNDNLESIIAGREGRGGEALSPEAQAALDRILSGQR